MKKVWLRLIVLVAMGLPMVAQAANYEISWQFVQHRDYADGSERNQLSFGIVDSDSGKELSDKSLMLGVILKDPNNEAVTLTYRPDPAYEYLGGSYDGWTNEWNYEEPYTAADFSYTITEELIPGTYQLEVQMVGQTINGSYEFVTQTDMPNVNSDSFMIRKDASGNMMWTWDIPQYQNATNQATHARANVSVYNQNSIVGSVNIVVPTNMGYLFVPADVVTGAESMGDEFRFNVLIRHTNNNNRGYSNTVSVYGSLDGGSYAPVGSITDNTPDFTWQHDNTSTWYRLWVQDGSGTPIYRQWYESSDICSSGRCSISPEDLGELTGGDYTWWIKSWVSEQNASWNDGTNFTLLE